MTQRSVLVIGGAGGVGTGIVDALLDGASFARILVSSRDEAKLEALRDRARRAPRLVPITGSVDDRRAADALLASALEHGELGAVVASLGGWWSGGALTALDDAGWHAALASLLTPHFVAARTFVPALANGGRYLSIGGDAALVPVSGAALVSIAGAAQLMLARALVAERTDAAWPIVEELIVSGSVKTNAAHHGAITPGEMTAREVGDVVARLLLDGTTGAWPNVTRDGPLVRMFPKASPR